MSTEQSRNTGAVFLFLLSTSAAMTLAASWVVTDLLLLRMEFDLGKFGAIKSSMFLLPALCYWFLAGPLQRSGADIAICRWSYLVRIVLPVSLPAIALRTGDESIRMWSCVVVFSLSYTAAMFANNTLLALYRRVFREEDFNRKSLLCTAISGIGCGLLALPLCWLLDRPELNTADFFRRFLYLQLALLVFEIPAFRALAYVKLPPAPPVPYSSLWSREVWQPFLMRPFRKLLGVNFGLSVWMGMLSSYWVVYLLRIRGWNASAIVAWEAMLCVVLLLISSHCGKLADRHGYWVLFRIAAALLLGIGCLFGLFPCILTFLLFQTMTYNGNNGVLSLLYRSLVLSASAKTAPPNQIPRFVAASALIQSLGSFGGCCLGTLLFSILMTWRGAEAEVFRLYFLLCNVTLISMLFPGMRARNAP